MDVVTSKVLSLLILFILTFLSGILPICIVRNLRKKEVSASDGDLERKLHARHGTILSILLSLGGGVLLSVALVHLLPEIREEFIDSYVSNDLTPMDFPLIEVVMCLGFFLVYGIEEAIMMYLKHRNCHSHLNPSGHDHSPAVATCENSDVDSCTRGSAKEETSLVGAAPAPSYGTNFREDGNTQSSSGFQGFVLIIALSFHAIFEGMSIGLQDSTSKVWTLSLGMLVHKLVLGFCIGLETLLHGTSERLVVLYMAVFAFMTPCGGIIGSVVDTVLVKSEMPMAILQSISAGTVLYVTFFEIFFQEKLNNQPGLLKLVSALFGFGLMTALTLLE